ncbi:MAG: tripartite tricarboxylate transporter substrate-binding protein [Acidobacteriota bacterium]
MTARRCSRLFLCLTAPAVLVLGTTCPVRAQNPLLIVAPAAPGGGWDQTARAVQQALGATEPGLRAQVENVPGAAGTIGLARFVAAERGNPDALLVTGLVMVGAIAVTSAPVNLALTTPIARLTGEYEVIVVPAASRFATLGDLMAAFTASPGVVSWGGGSAGGTDDLLVRLIAERVGIAPARVNYIAFPGGGAALAALLGGQVTAGVSGYGEFAGQIASGALRVLAVSAPERLPGLDTPTLREHGIELDLANWRGVVAPPGLSDRERDALVSRVERLARSAPWQATLERFGWTDMLLTGAAFRQFLLAEQARVDSVVRRLQATSGADAGQPASWTPTPHTAPIVALALLTVCGIVALARARSAWGTSGGGTANGRAVGLVVVLIAHALLFSFVGFIPASAALYVACTMLFGSRHWQRDVLIGLVATTVLFLAFTVGLGLTLPVDPVTSWMTR